MPGGFFPVGDEVGLGDGDWDGLWVIRIHLDEVEGDGVVECPLSIFHGPGGLICEDFLGGFIVGVECGDLYGL